MALPAFLTQQFMTGVVREFPTQGFIGRQILSELPVASMEVVYDVISRDAGIAPIIATSAESPLADKADYKRVLQGLATIREKELLNEDELLSLREIGTPDMIAGMAGLDRTRAEAAMRAIRQTTDRMSGRVNSRAEWMIWQALQGTMAYDDNAVNFSISFGLTGTHVISLSTTARWSQTATAVPLKNINDWMELIKLDAGRVATRMYVGPSVAGYLAQNTAIQTLLKENGRAEALASNMGVLGYLGQIFGLTVQEYVASYVTSAGTTSYFLPANVVVLMAEPRQADGEVLGNLLTGPAKANDFNTGLYGWVKEEEDPWATYVGAGMHCFPTIAHPNWIVVATVHS